MFCAMKSSVIVIGGAGALGRAVVKELSKASLATVSIDFNPNQEAESNVIIEKNSSLATQYKDVRRQLDRYLTQQGNVKGIFCTAGGWMGGTIGDENFLQVLLQMNSMNLETAALASNFAVNYLEKDGTLILTGAQAALHPCVGMMGYGISKSATHNLVSSIVQDEVFTKKACRAYGILPAMIDTPSNRAGMPNSNFLSWTKVSSPVPSRGPLIRFPSVSPKRLLGNASA